MDFQLSCNNVFEHFDINLFAKFRKKNSVKFCWKRIEMRTNVFFVGAMNHKMMSHLI